MFPRMCNAASPLMPKIYGHVFNQELAAGTLPRHKFCWYVKQDGLYLHDFSLALKQLSLRSTHNHHAKQLQWLSEKMLNAERKLHIKYLNGYHSGRLFSPTQYPIRKCQAIKKYTSHLFYTAQEASVEESIASFIPCFWIYTELGKRMMATKGYHRNNPYYAWISSYASDSFTSATQSMLTLVDELSVKIACPVKQQKMIDAFSTSVQCELLFFDSAYHPTFPLSMSQNTPSIIDQKLSFSA